MSNARNLRRPKATLRPAGTAGPSQPKPVFPPSPDVFFEGPRSYFSDDSSDNSSSPLSSPSPSPAQVVKADRALKSAPAIVKLQAVLTQAPPPADVRSSTPSDVSWRTATPPPVLEPASESESEPEPTASTSQIHYQEGGPVLAGTGGLTETGALVMAAAKVVRVRRGIHRPYHGPLPPGSPQKPTPNQTKAKTKAGYRHSTARSKAYKQAAKETGVSTKSVLDSGKATVRSRPKPLPLPLACLWTVLNRHKSKK